LALHDLQQKYASSLEVKIEKVNAELASSQERLRLTERLASLGTLSAGLGHDMGNVLMPLAAHIETIVKHIPSDNGLVSENVQSIRQSSDYLHTLAGGL